MRRVRYGAAGGVALAVGAFTALAATSGPATQAAPVAASGASSPVAGTPSAASPSVTPAEPATASPGFLPDRAGGAVAPGGDGPAAGASHAS